MTHIRYYLILLLIICTPAFSQKINYPVTTFPQFGNLSSGSVQTLCQDRQGLIWLGTEDGLCCYDGYKTHIYRSNNRNPYLLTNNYVTSLCEVKDYIFIGTRNGLNVLNVNNNKIFKTGFPDLDHSEIRSIVVDKRGFIWVGTYYRLIRLSADLKSCKRYDSRGVPVTSVNTLYLDRKDNLWVMFWEKGLYKYNKRTDRFDKMPPIGNKNNPFRILQDRNGNYWVATWGEGLFSMRQSKAGVTYKSIDVEGQEDKATSNIYTMIQDDNEGYIWMVGAPGLIVAKPVGDEFKIVNSSCIQTKVNGIMNNIFKDDDGGVWLATTNGAYFVDVFSSAIVNYSFGSLKKKYNFNPLLDAFLIDRDNEVWFHQLHKGFGFYNKNGEVTLFRGIPSLCHLNDLFDIVSINYYSQTPKGVWVLPQYSASIYLMNKSNGLPSISKRFDLASVGGGFPQAFYEDDKHNIWLSTSKGLLVKPFGHDFINTNIHDSDVFSISGSKNGTLWLSSQKKGVICLEPVKTKYSIYCKTIISIPTKIGLLPLDNVEALWVDDMRGLVWMGTAEGALVAFNMKTKKIQDRSIDLQNYINEKIFNITGDCKGNIWIGTFKSVLKYNPTGRSVLRFNSDDGISVLFYSKNAIFYDGNKNISFGGFGGIARFNVYDKFHCRKRISGPIISDVKINGTSFYETSNNALCNFNLKNKKIVFSSNARNIEIDFSACSYSHPNKIMYAYRLLGEEKEWTYVEGSRNYVFFNKLNKGVHVLQIKSSDTNGRWDNVIVSYTIIQEPKFYESNIAYFLYFVFLVTLAYFIYYRVRMNEKEKQRIRILKIEREKEEELNNTKIRYFTNVSHNFLTPITIISCLVDKMSMNPDSDKNKLYKITVNLKKLKSMIQQVLDYRKLEFGKMTLRVCKADLVEFIQRSCYDNFEPLLTSKGLEFCFDTKLNELQGYFDSEILDKILMNLISNAYKYTEQGSVRIVLDMETNDLNRYAIIKVVDTGRGISEEDQQKIFNRFYTVSNYREDSNGIGLSLVKDLVVLHHSIINLQSVVGSGSTFEVVLPIDKRAYTEKEIASSIEEDNLDSLISQLRNTKEEDHPVPLDVKFNNSEMERKTMLLVEDNDELITIMSETFASSYSVMNASNGLEALELLKQEQPDIIISDVMMPKMDGLEFCKTIKSDLKTSHIPIILLTARNSADDRVICYNAGADSYIAKPFELKVLSARIENFLKTKQKEEIGFRKSIEMDVDRLVISNMDKKFLKDVISLIESNIGDDKMDVAFLSQKVFMSNSTFYRKIKSVSGISPVEFIRTVRLRYAYKVLLEGKQNVTEVAYSCGFSTPRYFSTCFKNEFGISPGSVKSNT